MTRTLASFLADQAESDLREMLSGVKGAREAIRRDDERLQVEEQLITAALARKSRRVGSRSEGDSATGVTREQILDVIADLSEERFRPMVLHRAAVERGLDITPAALRQHLRRLVKGGYVRREGDDYLKPSASPNGRAAGSEHFSPDTVAAAPEEGRDMRLEVATR